MNDDTLLPFDLPSVRRKKLTVDFAGGNQSSYGGLFAVARGGAPARGVPAAYGGDAGSARSGPGAARDVRAGDGVRVGDCLRL
jgi:hypothetical protein